MFIQHEYDGIRNYGIKLPKNKYIICDYTLVTNPNWWSFCDNVGKWWKITSRELFYILNEAYPEDRDGYTNEEWFTMNEKELLSHIREHCNDIDGFRCDDNRKIIGVFESKYKFEYFTQKYFNSKHFRWRVDFSRDIQGMELELVIDKDVFLI
jgi:hypothetical protein